MVTTMTYKCDRQADHESRSPIYGMKSPGSQMVDPQFNELLFKFQFVAANTEALYYACEQYKRSLRCFFTESVKMFQIFHELLDEQDLPLPNSSSPSPSPNALDTPKSPQIFQGMGRPAADSGSTPDIGRLQRQMLVIARRAEQDLLFFEKSVQGPLSHLVKISRNVKRITTRRDAANAEWGQLAAKHHDIVCNRPVGKHARQQLEAGLEKRLQEALQKYETLNLMCKEGLERYLHLLGELFQDWFRNYYYTILRISYALHHFSWSIPEFRKICISNVAYSNEPNSAQFTVAQESTNQLCQNFHALHDTVSRQLVALVQGAPNGTAPRPLSGMMSSC